jgi:rhamnose utilization protein RhaD (predicted bifunctional aldolase and dehydrogenase)
LISHAPLVALLDHATLGDTAVDQALLDARIDPAARKPSVEAMFHAWLLTLPGVHFVGHTHPSAVNALLCSPYAEAFARQRRFPDEVVCCGPESVLVPYIDPGLALGCAIRDAVKSSIASTGIVPRVVLLKNHGLIALGATPAGVLAATLMTVKAARITLGAITAGGPVPMSRADVDRIAGRSDEHYRQRALGI